jgi:hypothetical protein
VDPFGELLMVSFVRNTTQTPIQIAMVFHTPGGSMSAPLSVELNAQERGYFYYAIPDPTLGTYTTEIRSFVKDASGEAVLIDDLVRSGSIIEEMLPNINEHMSVTRLPISYSELDYGTELEPRTGAPIPSGSTCSITVDTSGVDFVNRKSIVHFDFEEIGESVFVTDSSGNQWIRIGRPGTDGVLVVKLGEHSKRFSVSLLAAIYQSAYANAR